MAKRDKDQTVTAGATENQEPNGGTSQGAEPTKRVRTRDPRLDERDAVVKAWKDGGNKGLPETVKVADFKRIGQRRIDDALAALRLLCHVGNRTNYSFTEEQAAAVMASLHNALDDVERAFAPKGTSAHSVVL